MPCCTISLSRIIIVGVALLFPCYPNPPAVSLHALHCSNLLASLMTSYEVMHEFCGHFSLRKQTSKYNRNTHHPEPSVFRSMAQIKTYPFAVLFAKETLYFRKINPQSKTCLHILFSSFENVFCFG